MNGFSGWFDRTSGYALHRIHAAPLSGCCKEARPDGLLYSSLRRMSPDRPSSPLPDFFPKITKKSPGVRKSPNAGLRSLSPFCRQAIL